MMTTTTTDTPQPFYGPFPVPPGWAGARRELPDFMEQGQINRGRHTDHPAGRHFIRTNQCPPPPSLRYGDGAGNTVEENSSFFCLTRMC